MPPKAAKEIETDPTNDSDEALSIAELLDAEQGRDSESVVRKKVQHYKHVKYIRIGVLFLVWLSATVMLFLTEEQRGDFLGTVVPVKGKRWALKEQPEGDKLTLIMKAPFEEQLTDIVAGRRANDDEFRSGKSRRQLHVEVLRKFVNAKGQQEKEIVSEILEYSLEAPQSYDDLKLPRMVREHIFTLRPSGAGGAYFLDFRLFNVDRPLPLELRVIPCAIKTQQSIILSALLIAGMFVLFFWDVVSRGIVTMIVATLTVALLGLYHHRQPLREVLNHVDLDAILLIVGLTLIICVFAETGGDLYMAVQCYRLSNGHIWPMLTGMCAAVAFGAAFLDSTTILILTTSLAIRLGEVLQLNLASVLTCLILFSNTGFMLTRPGPTVDSVLLKKGVSDYSSIFKGYKNFLLQMLIPVGLSLCFTYAYVRLYYRSSEKMRIIESPIVARLRNGIRFWSRAAQGMHGYTKDEAALRQNMFSKVHRLRERLRRLGKMPTPAENFEQNLQQLQEQYKIRDRVLLIECCIVLLSVVAMQVAYEFRAHELSPGWTCLLFALVLLALANWQEFDSLMLKIDWSTLITITCLFIITRALEPLGLMEAIGTSTMSIVGSCPPEYRLTVASIALLIATTFSSAIMDSAHVSYVMSNKALYMAKDAQNFNIELEPLLLAVLLGAGFGANATLVSSVSNIVCAGIAEKHGFRFCFWDFFKVGIVVTIGNMLIGVLYLLIFNAVRGY